MWKAGAYCRVWMIDGVPAWMDEVCWQSWRFSVPELCSHCSFLASDPCDLKERCWLQLKNTKKNQSTFRKESYPLLTIRRHGLKIDPLWRNTLSRLSKSHPVCAPQICPLLLAQQDYDYSPITGPCQPSLNGFPSDPKGRNKPFSSKLLRPGEIILLCVVSQ